MDSELILEKEIPLLARIALDHLPKTDDSKIHDREMHTFATELSRQGHMPTAGKLRDIISKGEGEAYNTLLAAGRLKLLSIVFGTLAQNFGQSAQMAIGAAVDGFKFAAGFALPDAEIGQYLRDQLIRTYAMLGLCEPNEFVQEKMDGPQSAGQIILE